MLNSLKARLEARKHDGNLDSGDVVQTVILIAGFVIVAILVVVWLGTAIMNKGVDAGKCIESSNTYTNTVGSCDGSQGSASDDNSFTKDGGYQERYGNTDED
ncbi:hypothetical protein [Nocardioides massiliensis]|uniref:Class III signal peptide-containing protein n=1 Tax=Nocardioides massiliensis TaxID=1325935 RepID=A0ABT9NMK2_9ACTN|nr:hypothetical protein [Nocardioides massiliensis]MDP9821060.1 hypothetical protein [Nocardioides massiliensis]